MTTSRQLRLTILLQMILPYQILTLQSNPRIPGVHLEKSFKIKLHHKLLKKIQPKQENAHTAQVLQAERMVKRSRLDLQAGIIGYNVAVPIPAVDRGRGDPRNILGVIIHRDLNTDQYTIGVKAGILKGQYSRNQFDLCPQRLLSETGINTETLVTLRTAVIAQSASGGQGFVKCNCSGPSKCKTNRCKCFKAKLKCNSRCHGSLTCANK